MGKHYYYEAEYHCDCEVCGKQFRGVIRRGPLEYAGGVIPTGIGAAVDAAALLHNFIHEMHFVGGLYSLFR